MSALTWLLAGLGVAGAILNAFQNRSCFFFWVAANIGWISVNVARGLYPEATLFAVYLITALIGLANWRRRRPPSPTLTLPRNLWTGSRPRQTCRPG